MKPRIDGTAFGSITVAGETLEHDVIIRLGGCVEKRKKSLSRDLFGTSHIISVPEVEDLFSGGVRLLIIGTGQSGMAYLSAEAAALLRSKGCVVKVFRTPEAIRCWNDTEGEAVGLFHVTC